MTSRDMGLTGQTRDRKIRLESNIAKTARDAIWQHSLLLDSLL